MGFYILPPARVGHADGPASAWSQLRWAARLLGTANALMVASGARRLPSMHALASRALAARQAPGSEAFETAQADGTSLSEEQAIAEAQEDTAPGKRSDSGH